MFKWIKKILKSVKNIFIYKKDIDNIEKCDVTPKKININKNNAMNQYIKRLHIEIKKKDVKNIAISGGYGSGKTTIATNYVNEHPFTRNVVVSLGSFFESEVFNLKGVEEKINEKDNDLGGKKAEVPNATSGELTTIIDSEGNDKRSSKRGADNVLTVDERTLVDKIEKSILKQLAYVNKEQECPDSNISRVRTLNLKDILIYFSILYIFLTLLYYNFFDKINDFIKYILSFNGFNGVDSFVNFFINNERLIFILLCVFSGLFIVCLIYIFIIFCRYFQINARNITLKINGSEVKFEDEGDLTFTKQLKEILYIFKVNKYKIVFFEDIDRFNNDVALKVIEELKELNKIVNHFMKKKVTFVYLFKDKILRTHENKGKFYDYSLSVLPISTKYNALINLNDKLSELKITDTIDDKLKTIASTYIIDYRSIINLASDYALFREIINTSNYNKLFAIVLFKNYYVCEYDDILNKDNIIEKRFEDVKEKKIFLKEEKKKEIDLLNNKIDELNFFRNKSIRELKELLVYANSDIKNYPYPLTKIIIDGKEFSIESFLNDDFDMELLKNCDNEQFYRNSYGNIKIKYDYFNGKDGFFERINANTIIDEYEQDKKELLLEKEDIDRMSIAETFKKYCSIEENVELVDELIANGYIDNDYVDYVTSPPAKDEVTNEDINFIFSVIHEEYNFNKKINNCKYILKHLENYLSSPYILNIEFINFIMDKPHIDKVCNQFRELTDKKVEFLIDYSKNNSYRFNKFCDILWVKDINLWNNYQTLEMKDEVKKIFVYDLLNRELIKDNIENIEEFNKIIASTFKEIYMLYGNNEVIRNNLVKLKVKFNTVRDFSEEFKNFIYENNLYCFNRENFKGFMIVKLDITIPFFTIKDQRVLNYIYENINEFFETFYMKNKMFRFDNTNIVKEKILGSLNKEQYIKEVYKREKFIIGVNKVSKEYIEDAIEYNHINPTWRNINKIYNDNNKYKMGKFIVKNKKKLFYQKKSVKDLMIVKTFILKYLLLFVEEQDYDIIDIIGQNCDTRVLRLYTIYNKTFSEKLIVNNLINFNDSCLKELLKLDVDNINVYLDNWYKENKESLFNAVSKNETLFKMVLESENVTDDDKFEKIRRMKKKQLISMYIAFGDGKEHTIHSKTKPKIFDTLKARIEIININGDAYTFKMKK